MHSKRTTPYPARPIATTLWSALAVALLVALLAGCASTPKATPARNEFVASVAGYQVVASLDRSATFESGSDQALITFGHHRLRVEKGRVVLDDNETAAFPRTASRVEIVVAQGQLRVTADGEEMWKKPMPRE